MRKLTVISILFLSILYFFQPVCQAMHVVSSREIASFDTSGLWGNTASVRTVGQWNEYIRFTFYVPDNYNGKIHGSFLVSGNANNINLDFLPGGVIKIFEFKAVDPDMVFWIVKDGTGNDSGLTHDFYLIGPYSDYYTTYADMNNIVTMGWNSTHMKVVQLSDDAWPVLQGFADSGSSNVLQENLVLSWDDTAQWFKMTNYPLDTMVHEIKAQ